MANLASTNMIKDFIETFKELKDELNIYYKSQIQDLLFEYELLK